MFKKLFLFFLISLCAVNFAFTAQLWENRLASEISGAPVFLKNRIFVSTKNSSVYSFKLNGKLVWKRNFKSALLNPLTYFRNRLFVPLHNKRLLILNLNGKIVKSIKLKSSPCSSVIPLEKYVYIFEKRGTVLKYDLEKSEIIKKREFKDLFSSSAALDKKTGHIIITDQKRNIICMDTELNVRWKFKTAGIVLSCPAVTQTSDVYITSMDHHIYKISKNGKLMWKFKTNRWIKSSPVIDEQGNVYFGSYDKYFYSLDSKGKLRWKYKCGCAVNAGAVIDNSGNIYTGDSSGQVLVLSGRGEKKFSFKTDDFIRSDFSISSEKKIFIAGCIDSRLFAFSSFDVLGRKAQWVKVHERANLGYKE